MLLRIVPGIFLRFEGKAHAKWKKRPAYLCGLQEAEFIEGGATYFSKVYRYDSLTLPKGSSAFPFEYELPSRLPPSLGLKHVKISYSIDALIRTKGEDYRQRKPFAVRGLFNLTAFPELRQATTKTAREVVQGSSCWSPSQLLVLSFSVRKQGFVHGELVKSELLIKEGLQGLNSTAMVTAAEVHLIQEIEILTGEVSHLRRRIVVKNDMLRASEVEHHSRKITFVLKVPDSALISYEGESRDFISIRYFLRLALGKSSFPYNNYNISIPIKIGSIWILEETTLPSSVAAFLSKVDRAKKETKTKSDIESAQPPQVPEIFVDAVEELCSHSQSCKATPDSSPRRKLQASLIGRRNTVCDTSGTLCRPQHAFLHE